MNWTMDCHEEIEKYAQAIKDEIRHLQYYGGRRYRIFDGERINYDHHQYVYKVECDSELRMFEADPIKIILNGIEYPATILSVNEFTIWFTIGNDLGKKIETAYLANSPWMLLDALVKRLDLVSQGRIAQTLIREGPRLARKGSFDDIPNKSALKDHIERNPITFIWGPPGTGKTTTLAELSIAFMERGLRVLIVSQSNISVDEAVHKIRKQCLDNHKRHYLLSGQVMRYGYIKTEVLKDDLYCNAYNYVVNFIKPIRDKKRELDEIAEQIKQKKDVKFENLDAERKKLREQINSEQKKIIQKSSIIATTISKAQIDPLIYEELTFDVVILDEASMAYIPQVFFAASLAKKKFICIGDFNQLAPISQSRNNDDLKDDIYTFTHIVEFQDKAARKDPCMNYHPWLIMLDRQYRSHPRIMTFSNNTYYQKMISNDESVMNNSGLEGIMKKEPCAQSVMALVDTSDLYAVCQSTSDNSRFNILSAILCVNIAMAARKINKKCTIAIITPYAAQAKLMKKMILDCSKGKQRYDIDCSTIHQFQGSERDIIVFDTVESYPKRRPGLLTSSNTNRALDRLINVAITRAKGKFILVANVSYWNDYHPSERNAIVDLIKFIKKNEHYYNSDKLDKLLSLRVNKGIPLEFKDLDDVEKQFLDKLGEAKKNVMIMLPEGSIDNDHWLNICAELKKAGIDVTIKSKKQIKLNGFEAKKTTNAFWPIVIIDNKDAWYGMPLGKHAFSLRNKIVEEHKQMVAHIKGSQTIKLITQYFDSNLVSVTSNYNGEGIDRFRLYVKLKCKCPECKSPLTLKRGFSLYLECPHCKHREWITPELVNAFILDNAIKCPEDGGALKAFVGRGRGLQIGCEHKHIMTLEVLLAQQV